MLGSAWGCLTKKWWKELGPQNGTCVDVVVFFVYEWQSPAAQRICVLHVVGHVHPNALVCGYFLMEPSKRAFAPSNRFFLSSFDSKYIVYHQSTYDILWLDLYTCRIVDLSFLSAGLRQMWVATVANFKSLHGFTKFTTQSQAREAERVGSPMLSACREM